MWYKPVKRGFDGGVSAVFTMLKSAKGWKNKEGSTIIRVAYISLVGSIYFILRFLIDSCKDNLMILAIESHFPYPRPVLLNSWKHNITNLAIKFFFPYQRPILLYLGLLF